MEQIKDNLWKLTNTFYLKKNKSGNYNIIAPIKDPITNKINYFNLFTSGSWFNLIKVIIVVSIILLITFSYFNETKDCLELRNKIAVGEIVCYNYSLSNSYTGWGDLNGTGYKSDLVLSPKDNAKILNK